MDKVGRGDKVYKVFKGFRVIKVFKAWERLGIGIGILLPDFERILSGF